jgi:alpha-galactosidase
MPRIAIIGAGSASFGLASLIDAFSTPELFGSEIVLVDIDVATGHRMLRAADRINGELHAGYRFSFTPDRRTALVGADFVILSIAIDRIAMWQQDFGVPKKHGIDHVLGENGGPGAVFHTLRNIPIVLDICRDVEELCPDALLINFTNPESRICLAISRYTKVKAIGLCHQIHEGVRIVSRILDRDPATLRVRACGLNHFSWFTDLRDAADGTDLYPELRRRMETFDPSFEKLSRFMDHRFGLFPMAGDEHLGEYLPFAHEMTSTKGADFAASPAYRAATTKRIEDVGDPTVPLEEGLLKPSGETAFRIIRSISTNRAETLDSVNLRNGGCIANLPPEAIVEVPALVGADGVHGLQMGALPPAIAALCLQQYQVQSLVVDAAVTGDRDKVLQALLVDPCVPSAAAAVGIFEELMEINRPYLRNFR